MKDIYVMGINTSNHDRSACLLKNGEIICAIDEERLDRRKHSQGFYREDSKSIIIPPLAAINYCLKYENISIDNLDLIVSGRSMTSCIEEIKKYIPIKDERKLIEYDLPSHHLAHAYSSYFASDYNESLILISDEQGHWLSNEKFEKMSVFIGRDSRIESYKQFLGDYLDISVGMFYDLFATILNFSDGGIPAAGKLMGLASCGHYEESESLIDCLPDGNVKINLENLITYLKNKNLLNWNIELDNIVSDHPYKYQTILEEIGKYIIKVEWDESIAPNIAFKAQYELEKAIIHIVNKLVDETGLKTLCLSGGIFLNSIINNKILQETKIEKIYIQPAATDDGTALGYAYIGYYKILGKQNRVPLRNIYLGREYSNYEIEKELSKYNIKYEHSDDITSVAASFLEKGKIICWYQGRAEFGPRALGNRSILADPRLDGIKDIINSKVKRRESFRPFAPSVILEKCEEYFNLKYESPYMLLVTDVIDTGLPAITHYDNTARPQTVTREENEIYYDLIKKFGDLTSKYVILNTSFNVNGEPLVETPYDAIKSFFITDADILIMGNYYIDKEAYNNDELNTLQEVFLDWQKDNFFSIGLSVFKSENYSKAKYYFNKVINSPTFNQLSDLNRIVLYYNLASIYYFEENYAKANEYLNKIIHGVTLNFNVSAVVEFQSMINEKLGDKKISELLKIISNELKIMEEKGDIVTYFVEKAQKEEV